MLSSSLHNARVDASATDVGMRFKDWDGVRKETEYIIRVRKETEYIIKDIFSSHDTIAASQKPCFREPWRVGDAIVSRGHAGYTTSKCGHLYLCQNRSQQPRAEKTGRGSLLDHPSWIPDDPIGQGTKLNCSSKDNWNLQKWFDLIDDSGRA